MGNYERNPLMADFSVDYFETKDGVRLRYLHKGEGMPFILLHGYSDDADMWMLNAPAYADQYAVYCIDQRGHANSPALHGARSRVPDRGLGAGQSLSEGPRPAVPSLNR